MEADDLLAHAAAVLERLGLPYLVTGSMATIVYGEPRFTNDVDVVVRLPADRVEELCAAFPDDEFYVSPQAAALAVRRRGQFNVLHPRSGLKLDVMVANESAFDRSRFSRARPVETGPGRTVAFASAEDVLLKKLEYFREGGSEKHLRDVAGILRISGDRVDRRYVDHWAAELGLTELWRRVAQRADAGDDAPDGRSATSEDD